MAAALLAASHTASAQSAAAPPAAEAARAYDIAPGPLGQTLVAIAQQSGRTVSVDPALVAGLQAPAVRGSYTPEQAAQAALAGSGLTLTRNANGVWGVARAASQAPATAQGVTQATAVLSEVTVTADAARDGTTEGTGSYTTDITRTATGLALSPRETPQSVTVVTRQQMDDQAATSVQDALQSTTGISFAALDRGRNYLSARGFEISNFQIDGLPTTNSNIGIETSGAAIFDRVEVVRGATGLLNGTGDPSATINLVRKRANSHRFASSVQAELGSWGHRAATADLSAPWNASGTVRGRLVAHALQENSFIDLENRRGKTLYGVVEADLTPATLLTLGASQEDIKRNGVYWGGLSYWYADGTRTDWPRSKTTSTRWGHWDTTERTAFARLEHALENSWKLRADLGYYKKKETSELVYLFGIPDRTTGLGYQPMMDYYRSQPTQTQLAFSASGPFSLWGREHDLNVGVIHTRLKTGWDARNLLDPDVPPVGNFNLWDGSYPQPAWSDFYVGSRTNERTTSAYAVTRLQLAEPLKLIFGAQWTRWQRDEKEAVWTPEAYTTQKNVITPYGGLVYDVTQDVSLYASYTKIFKPQAALDRNGRYLDPIDGRGMEVGVKGEFLDGRLNASAAVFRIDQDKLAVPDDGYVVPGTTVQAMRSARGAKSQGIELEASGEIARGWQLSAGWTRFRARDAEGEDVQAFHPRQQFKLFTKYEFRGDLTGLALGSGLTWQSRPPFARTNPVTGLMEPVGQPAYTLVDLMASYRFNRQTSVQLNIKNVFDKKYYSGVWNTFTYGAPRSFTVQLKHTF
ncbi:TonB-dependent siderophore receptor [Acidovorax sp.]|uniref:TonB-dependent siderophore receptor n=1 Tax=Acidovorax sp. TaxID=1872122 RepID=UPI0039E22DEA